MPHLNKKRTSAFVFVVVFDLFTCNSTTFFLGAQTQLILGYAEARKCLSNKMLHKIVLADSTCFK